MSYLIKSGRISHSLLSDKNSQDQSCNVHVLRSSHSLEASHKDIVEAHPLPAVMSSSGMATVGMESLSNCLESSVVDRGMVFGPLTQLQDDIYQRYLLIVESDFTLRKWSTRFRGRIPPRFLYEANDAVAIVLSRKNITDLWKLDCLIYAAATVVVGKIQRRNSPCAKQQKVVEKIDERVLELRKLISRMTEEIKRQKQNQSLTQRLRRNRRQFRFLFHSCSLEKLSREREKFLGKLRTLTLKRRNAKEQLKCKTENNLFRNNPRQLFRQWRCRSLTSSEPSDFPNMDAFDQFWRPLFETPSTYNKNAIWLESFQNMYSGTVSTDGVSISVDRLTITLKSMKQRTSPGPDGIVTFWWRHLSSCHLLLSSLISQILNDPSTEIPSWLPVDVRF